MGHANPPDALSTLGRRIELLDRLTEGPRDKRSLVETLPVSRSTVSRGISELSAHGFVERDGGEFRATTAGRIAARQYHQSTGTLAALIDVDGALSRLPDGCIPPPALFREGRVVTEEGEPLRYLLERVSETDRVVCVRGPLRPELPAAIRDGVLEGSFAFRLTLTEDAADLLESYHRGDLDAMLDAGGFELSTLEADLPFGLYLAERGAKREAYLALHDESYRVRSVVHATNGEALAWTERQLDRFRERSTRYEPA